MCTGTPLSGLRDHLSHCQDFILRKIIGVATDRKGENVVSDAVRSQHHPTVWRPHLGKPDRPGVWIHSTHLARQESVLPRVHQMLTYCR